MVSTALTACALLATPARAANWTGATADWFDPANWNGGVPTSGNQANINNGGTAQIGADGAAASSVWIGQNAGQIGALEVNGPDADLTTPGVVFVGFSGSGSLDISGGGVVNSGGSTMGATGTGSGSVTVDGEGSAFNNAGLTVGGDGEGTLDITNGGYVFSTSSTIGSGSTGSGHVTIDGAGSSWQSLYSLYVGYDGDATLDISNGGAMSSQGADVGFQSGSSGEVTVDGEESLWTVDGELNVGYEGDGNLDITNGGKVSDFNGIVGSEAGSTGAVTVDGEGSAWTNSNYLIVGNQGEGTLDINNGGTVSSNTGYIGNFATGTGVVTVDGDGSTWTTDGSLYVGLGGQGTLQITNGGVVTSEDIFVGFSSGSSGSITVDGDGSSLVGNGALYLGFQDEGSLTVANGASAEFTVIYLGLFGGTDSTINIGAAMGETAVAAGSLDTDLIVFNSGVGTLVFNHTDTDYELDAVLSGSGIIRQIGSGSTVLSGNSSNFAGTTSVERSALFVNGRLGGSVSVGAARFGGSGTVSNVTLGNGSVIAPGHNGVGTLSVLGDLTFNADSTYEVEVDPASAANDLIHVTGTAYLNNALVEHIGLSGTYPWYVSRTILTADGGIDGTFEFVTSNYAFLIPDLSYDVFNVRMTLLRNDIDFAEVATSPNQHGVAGAATMLGMGNPIYDEIIAMTAEQAQAAFDALSGEAYSSEGTAAFNAAQQLRDVLQARLQVLASGSKVASLAYAPAAGDELTGDAPAVWGQVFGTWGVNDATATAAKLERRSSGFLGGADKAVGEDSRIGVALGYSHSDFDVKSLLSSSKSDSFHLAGYAGTKLGVFDLGSNISYSYGRADAKRTVIVGGLTNNLSSDYDTHTVQASVEAGIDVDMTEVVLTPFAGLAGTYVRTDSFTETGGPAALAIDASDNITGVTSLGLRVRREAGHVALTGSAAWRHAFGDVAPASRVAFASAPAASFIVRGAPVAEDTLAVGAHIDFDIAQATRLTFGYAGEFASDARDHGLRSELRVEF
ncbi:MAG: autotransporter domain-containing protein [Parvibaculum sp.]|nr:autotransporter domain-containing protein [Parvibaculum sp.]